MTGGFPYGSGETFLENEITYLANAFEEVQILCPFSSDSNHRKLPDNCSILFYSKSISLKEKILAFGGFFRALAWKEVKIIRSDYQLKLNKGILSTLLISLYQARKIVQFCEKKVLKGKEGESIVFYSYWCDDNALALALLKEKYPKVRCISRTHGWDVYFDVHALKYLPFRQFISTKLDAIFPISDKGKVAIQEVWKSAANSTVHVARLGVKKQTISTETNNNSIFTLVSCSNVIPLKRVELIAEAVLAYEKPIQWIHFGDGIQLEYIQKKCAENQKQNQHIEFKGRVSNEEVLQFYQKNQVDAFINVSTSEGIPVSIMEAMSFGIPCIATDVGGNSEIVNNQNGVLLNANPRFNEIQSAFKTVLNQPELRKNAFETWETKYNAEKNYSEFVNQLKSI